MGAAVLASLKAAAVGVVPAGSYYLVSGGDAGPLALVFFGGPAVFVVLAAGAEWARMPELPVPDETPQGVLSQDEAAERLYELTLDYWERDPCDS